MNNIRQKADTAVGGILLFGCMPSFIILIVIVSLMRPCMGYGKMDLDNSYITRRYMYDRIYVTDSTSNGYELLYYTTNSVTEARYKEIHSRQPLRDSYKRLQVEAGEHFNHKLIDTDIYDFVEYAKTFDINSDDVRLVNIWVYGCEYTKLYQRPHEKYPNGWKFSDDNDLGLLFLKENDVYPYSSSSLHTYRYWECDATSSKDERYTHVTEVDRLRSKR